MGRLGGVLRPWLCLLRWLGGHYPGLPAHIETDFHCRYPNALRQRRDPNLRRIEYISLARCRVEENAMNYGLAGFSVVALPVVLAATALAQAPEGPMTPRPGTQIQAAPPEALAKITSRVTLVNTPVTVRDSKGAMIHDLDQQDFVITDNGVRQKITHFDVGGDPISLVVVVETSSRVDPLLPQLRKTGILFTEQVMGPEAEAAVIGFDDHVNKLQDFTPSHDAVQSAFAGLKT